MARCASLPDPMDAAEAGVWPELVSVPAHLSVAEDAGILVETYLANDVHGHAVPACSVSLLREGNPVGAMVLTEAQLRGLLVALQRAAAELAEGLFL